MPCTGFGAGICVASLKPLSTFAISALMLKRSAVENIFVIVGSRTCKAPFVNVTGIDDNWRREG